VLLTGTGMAPNATLNVTALAFNPQIVSTAGGNQFFTLTNSGNVNLTFGSISVTGANPGDFATTTTCAASVPVGATCSVFVTFTPSAGGPRSAVLTISDSAPSGTQTVNLSGTGQDFAIAAAGSGSQSIAPGQSAGFQLQVMPQGGFNQSVTLGCSGAPATTTCTVSPASVPMNGSAGVNVSVTVFTEAASAALPRRPGGPLTDAQRLYPIFVICLLALCIAVAKRRDALDSPASAARLAGFAVMVALIAGLSGCVGSTGGGTHIQGTLAGTYTLTVTGNSAPLTQTVTLTVTVQ
jgi:hypothetical protein